MSFHKVNTLFRIKGIKISPINVIVIVISFVMCALFAVSTFKVWNRAAAMITAYENGIEYRNNGRMAKEGSYYLTEQVHMFVVSENMMYADNYFYELNVTRRRKTAINNLRAYSAGAGGYDALLAAVECSDELSQREIYAIRLVAEAKNDDISQYDSRVIECELNKEDAQLSPDEKRALAKELVFGEEYLEYRNNIDAQVQQFMDGTFEQSEGVTDNAHSQISHNIVNQCIFVAVMLLLNVLLFLMIQFLILKPLKIYMKCIREDRTFEMLGAYEFKYFALVYNNIFEINHENEKMLRHKADHDAATGLLNKGAFERVSKQYERKDMPIALLVMDIDNFKTINDTYGHDTGDDVIKYVGELLMHSFRPSDVLSRFGGDEFTVIMPDVTTASAGNIKIKMDNMNKILQSPKNGMPKVSLSIGAAFSESGYSEELFKNADNALYYAKEHGRCGCAFSDTVIRAYKK